MRVACILLFMQTFLHSQDWAQIVKIFMYQHMQKVIRVATGQEVPEAMKA